jgi:heptosyltransferase-2
LLCGPAKIVEKSGHAARQLAQPIEQLGINVADLTERVFLSADDRRFAHEFLRSSSQPIVAIHPGSGSKEKNWPLENWIELVSTKGGLSKAKGELGHMGKQLSLVVVSGEADQAQTAQLEQAWKGRDVRYAKNLPLPRLAAVLEHTIFVGHDSGISHLAAASGAKCILLFGATDPHVWAPRNENVHVLRAPNEEITNLTIDTVKLPLAAAISDSISAAV